MLRIDNAGRITKIRFTMVSVILFTLAILFTFCRIIIRLRYQTGRLLLDDAFLAFGVVCLCVSFALVFTFLPNLFLAEAVTGYQKTAFPLDKVNQLLQFHLINVIFLVLTWTTIFAVKFSYLVLFKSLICRVRKLTIYWWTVTCITGLTWGFGVIGAFLPCPYFEMPRFKSCGQKSNASRVIGWMVTATVLDVITDILIIAIPIQLLWRVKIKLGQKLAIGASISLSIVMIIVALVRASAIRLPPLGIFDLTWSTFWQLSEACIAVMMFSLTAFRSFFVAHRPNIRKSPKKQPLYLSRRIHISPKQVWRSRARADSEDMEGLPEVPRSTLTGMRPFKANESIDSSQFGDM